MEQDLEGNSMLASLDDVKEYLVASFIGVQQQRKHRVITTYSSIVYLRTYQGRRTPINASLAILTIEI